MSQSKKTDEKTFKRVLTTEEMKEQIKPCFNEFIKNYLNRNLTQLTANYKFVKEVMIYINNEYNKKLNNFWKNIYLSKNQEAIEKLLSNENELYSKQLNFIHAIPDLIVSYNDEIDIDYVFLTEKFYEIKDEKEIDKFNKTLNSFQLKFAELISTDITSKKEEPVSIVSLYQFGNFVLTFLNHFEFRKKVLNLCLTLAKLKIENAFKEIINNWLIQNNNIVWKICD